MVKNSLLVQPSCPKLGQEKTSNSQGHNSQKNNKKVFMIIK